MASETKRTSGTEKKINALDDLSKYRSNIQPRNIIIQRSPSNLGAPTLSKQVSKRDSYSPYSSSGMSTIPYGSQTSTGVTAVKESREQEKKNLQGLNERLANYIEKVRFLESQNRKLEDELDKLKAKWGKETSQIKAMYQAELDDARRVLDEAVKDKSRLEIRLASMEDLVEELKQSLMDALMDAENAKKKIEHQYKQLSDLEAKNGLQKKRLDSLEAEKDKEKAQIKKLEDALNAARSDLDGETLLHIDAENKKQTLEEELEFLKALHEQELKELQSLAFKDSTAENRQYWKTEMGNALREIQASYDDKIDIMRGEMDTRYNSRLQHVQNGAVQNNMQQVNVKEESVRIRDQMKVLRDKLAETENKCALLDRELDKLKREKEERERDLEHRNGELSDQCIKQQAEMEAMLKELELIIDAKLGLELEILAYRRLLDGVERPFQLKDMINSVLPSEGSKEITSQPTDPASQIKTGEIISKIPFQKSAKGSLAIFESSPDGKYVALENTGRKEEELGNWSLTRNIDGKDSATYKFHESLTLRPSQKVKVWSKGTKPFTGATDDIESDQNWGVGSHIITKLVNPAGEERATFSQQTKSP